jgi:hypothetical protein
VNLTLTHALLATTDEQPHGFLKVRGPHLIHEVELMAEAGLVDASVGNADSEAFAVINRVTDSGRRFLRTFRYKTPPGIASLASANA